MQVLILLQCFRRFVPSAIRQRLADWKCRISVFVEGEAFDIDDDIEKDEAPGCRLQTNGESLWDVTVVPSSTGSGSLPAPDFSRPHTTDLPMPEIDALIEAFSTPSRDRDAFP